MEDKEKIEVSFYEKFLIWLRWNLYCIAALAIFTFIKVQFYGQEMIVHSLGFQNRPVLDPDTREQLAEEALARKGKKGV